MERKADVKEIARKVYEFFTGLPKQVLVLMIPLVSWVSLLVYFGGDLTVGRIREAISSGNIIDVFAVLALLISALVLLLSVAWFIRELIPKLIATGGYVLAFFLLVLSIYGLVRGATMNVVSLLLTFVLMVSSIILGKWKR